MSAGQVIRARVGAGSRPGGGARTAPAAAGAASAEHPPRRVDWVLAVAVALLCAVGSLLVWSATRERMLAVQGDPQSFFKKHLLNIAIGAVLALGVSLADTRLIHAYAPVLYLASLGGLVAVLAVGSTRNGAKAWIDLPAGFSIQPSEFAKVALVVGMAMLLSEKRDGETDPRNGDVALSLLLAGVPMGLVLLQDDLGSVMVLAALIFGVVALSGAPLRWVVGLLAGAVAGGVLIVLGGGLSGYQVDRLVSFVDPTSDPDGAGYNTQQARIAIGAGGVDGTGLFKGPQTQGRFVPEQQTDFIYTVAGEELGLVGAGGIVLLLGVILWRGCRIAVHAPDLYGRLVAGGVVCWFTFQAFENIGMCLGIMPVTGLPLPFVSYGGSSMFACMLGVGLLQNVHSRREA